MCTRIAAAFLGMYHPKQARQYARVVTQTIMVRRRGRRAPNDSESTGKIGQEIPQGQLAPLRPNYDALPEPGARVEAEPEGTFADAKAVTISADTKPEPVIGKLVHEMQPESPSVPPPAAQAASQKAPRGSVVLTIGLPGSGKTTWFKRRAVQPLSSDMLRSILFDDITEQRYQGLVFSTLRSLLRARLIAKMPWNYVDATNLSPHERRQWIKMAKSFGYDVHAVFFDVPFEVCMERNRRRERTVSDEVMEKMAERLRAPSFKEGFSKITVVRVKGAGPSTAVQPYGEGADDATSEPDMDPTGDEPGEFSDGQE
jgi:predicted kinase